MCIYRESRDKYRVSEAVVVQLVLFVVDVTFEIVVEGTIVSVERHPVTEVLMFVAGLEGVVVEAFVVGVAHVVDLVGFVLAAVMMVVVVVVVVTVVVVE
jgi:hypothetical protein